MNDAEDIYRMIRQLGKIQATVNVCAMQCNRLTDNMQILAMKSSAYDCIAEILIDREVKE